MLTYSFVPSDTFYFFHLDHQQNISHYQMHQLMCLCLSSFFIKQFSSNKQIMHIYISMHNHLFPPR